MMRDQAFTQSHISAVLADALKLHQTGDLVHAEVLYRRILEMDSENFDAIHLLAVIGYSTNHIDASLDLFERAFSKKPENFSLLVNYGVALQKAGRSQDAINLYDQALASNPGSFEANLNKAHSLLAINDLEEAEYRYRKCLDQKPDDPTLLTCLGNVYLKKDDWVLAAQYYERAQALDPNMVAPYVSLAQICRDRQWGSTATLLCARALRFDPRNPIARNIGGHAALKTGNLKQGWKLYEGRFFNSDDLVNRRPVPPVYWDGEDLDGKSILIWTEQGVGDEILYASMIAEMVQTAKRVIFECQPRMVPVYKRSFPSMEVVGWEKLTPSTTPKAGVDYQSSIGSLGQFLRPGFDSFPKHMGYLIADQKKVANLRARYGAGPLIGISWRSSAVRGKKSSPLLDWAPILRIPGVRFVCLQYGDNRQEISDVKNALGVDVIQDDLVDPLQDMDSFFAQVAAMDLVITTSNTTVHVAGSLGIPTWMLLQHRGGLHWYWFAQREDCPWYPSARLFRQLGGSSSSEKWWTRVLQRVSRALPEWLAEYQRT